MKNSIRLFLLIATFYSYATYNFAQDKNQYNEKNYKSEFDSLKFLKEQNEISKKTLLNDIVELKKMGVSEIFPPGSPTYKIAEYINDWVVQHPKEY